MEKNLEIKGPSIPRSAKSRQVSGTSETADIFRSSTFDQVLLAVYGKLSSFVGLARLCHPPSVLQSASVNYSTSLLVRDLSGWPKWLWWRPHGRKKVLPQGLACCNNLPWRQWRFCRWAVTRLAWLHLTVQTCMFTQNFWFRNALDSSWHIPKESQKNNFKCEASGQSKWAPMWWLTFHQWASHSPLSQKVGQTDEVPTLLQGCYRRWLSQTSFVATGWLAKVAWHFRYFTYFTWNQNKTANYSKLLQRAGQCQDMWSIVWH